MNRFLLAPLLLSFISPVKANLDTEIGRQYNKELGRLIAEVIEAAKHMDKESLMTLNNSDELRGSWEQQRGLDGIKG